METQTLTNVFASQAKENLDFANSYYATLAKGITSPSKFNNDLKYNMALMCTEKYFIALMATYDESPAMHTPLGLYREASMVEPELTPTIKQTCILIGKFEGICSLEDFGYRTPTDNDLKQMVEGMKEIKELTEKRVNCFLA
jgi:hypothetical protein